MEHKLEIDTDGEVIHVDSDNGESEDDNVVEVSTSGGALFGAPQQVFIVRSLSKAMTGFRPSVMCEGFLVELSKASSSYILAPLGQDQQLSFKYEPPSPKFSRKRPSCVSYRLQLLHGSQFLYSLRGLPKALRCKRSARALEWGPVHLLFAAAADMDRFIATIKYVDIEEMDMDVEQQYVRQQQATAPPGDEPPSKRRAGVAGAYLTSSVAVDTAAAEAQGGVGESAAGECESVGGADALLRDNRREVSLVGMQWAEVASLLLLMEGDCVGGASVDTPSGESATAAAAAAAEQPEAAAEGPAAGGWGGPFSWGWWQGSQLGSSMLPATAGTAMLLAAAAAAFVIMGSWSGRLARGGRGQGS